MIDDSGQPEDLTPVQAPKNPQPTSRPLLYFTAAVPQQHPSPPRKTLNCEAGHNAGTAGAAVSYECAWQFERDFKPFFGETPTEKASKLRARISKRLPDAVEQQETAGSQ